MLQNYKGFTFIEVMFSLVIVTITVASTAPVLFIVLNERQTVADQLAAYEILQNNFEEALAKNLKNIYEKTIEKNGTVFSLYSELNEVQLKICVQWDGRNGRAYEEC